MDPSDLYHLEEDIPRLDRPVMVAAPEGWIDAGLGGGGALATLLSGIETYPVATFNSEELIDYRARRPTSIISDGVYTDLEWPQIELLGGSDSEGNHLLILVGPEPDQRWLGFSQAVGDLAEHFGVRLLVGLGAFPAPVPHTRPAPLVASASSAELAEMVGVVKAEVRVPAGIHAALARRFAVSDIPAIGIWARVPHYAANAPYPPASLMLLEGLNRVAGIAIDTTELAQAADETRQRLDELTANSPQHQVLVAQLEAQSDAEAQDDGRGWDGKLPSGDELAAELEQFLRGQGGAE
ncbi:MAG: proteasome assembly chaperone family protein [Acidimicrobiales bacterium]